MESEDSSPCGSKKKHSSGGKRRERVQGEKYNHVLPSSAPSPTSSPPPGAGDGGGPGSGEGGGRDTSPCRISKASSCLKPVKNKSPRSSRPNNKGTSLADEDIIDGFAFLSFRSLQELEVSSIFIYADKFNVYIFCASCMW